MDSKKAKKKAWLFTQSQALFITIKLFALNKLPSYAEACSFGLLFSFLPIFMITLIVMTRILHATPELIEPLLNSILSAVPQMGRFFAPDRFMRMLSSAKIGGLFEIFIFAFAFWMSRRFLVSIFQSFKMIFHTRHERKSVYSQLMMFAVVTIIIFAFTAVVFAYILLRYVTGLSVFVSLVQRFPQLDIFNHDRRKKAEHRMETEMGSCSRIDDQVTKGAGWMPWHWTPKKGVVSCEKLWGAASRH